MKSQKVLNEYILEFGASIFRERPFLAQARTRGPLSMRTAAATAEFREPIDAFADRFRVTVALVAEYQNLNSGKRLDKTCYYNVFLF